jgi:hypothetical protein
MIGGKTAIDLKDYYTVNGVDIQTDYHGVVLPIAPHESLFPPIVDFGSHFDSLDEMGATAIARVKPTNPIADLSTALGELHTEGLPRLPGIQSGKERTRVAKKAGGEYLGIQFGWLPFVSDIKAVAHGVTNADRIIAQYVRDSGKLVRRSYDFPEHTEFSTIDLGPGHRPFTGPTTSHLDVQIPEGRLIRDEKIITREKFSGGFTYHLPGELAGQASTSKSALYAKKVLGLDLTPDTVWNLTPWSWAADWFSNTGDVINNLSDYATDGLVLRYGYMQRHVVVSHSYRLVDSISEVPLIFVTEYKMRRKANPFGFGVQWDGLTPRQIAISVALGLNRVL